MGAGSSSGVAATGFRTLAPARTAPLDTAAAASFTWTAAAGALLYRLEIEDADDDVLLQAVVRREQQSYSAPPLLRERAGARSFRWRVAALGAGGRISDATAWRDARFAGPRTMP